MNIISIIGFVVAFAVLIAGMYLASPKLTLFLDYPSLFIVLGGSFAATAISFQLNRIKILFTIFFRRILKGDKVNHKTVAEELVLIADKHKKGEALLSLAETTDDHFIKESLEMLADGIIPVDEVVEILQSRNKNLLTMHMNESNKMKTVSKFPPAFGMIGTTIGMIVLLANLGGADAMKMIGPAMAVALITTLYGAVFANLIFIPVAENLTDSSKEIFLKNEIIIEAIKLITAKTNPVIVTERLNSFLSPKERMNWKEVLGSSNSSTTSAKAA